MSALELSSKQLLAPLEQGDAAKFASKQHGLELVYSGRPGLIAFGNVLSMLMKPVVINLEI